MNVRWKYCAPEGRVEVRKLACALKQLVIDQGGSKLPHSKARALRSGSRILSCAGSISFLLFYRATANWKHSSTANRKFSQKRRGCDKYTCKIRRFFLTGCFMASSNRNRQIRPGGALHMFRHHPAIDRSVGGDWCMFFLVIWQIIINPIDIAWIMLKEFIDGSLDYTCTFIRGNPGERLLCPPFWPESPPHVFV
jgi:hypothetical protein